uniref:DUF659 domain-containing protein n=1 Tax=Phaseolus vulgaris TaxID=3885 RepID=V7BSU5_PHAVU|nr:hypothetical protein PHAVU_005G040200g [Phaseolus vulgaris]ESW21082.1 hypothetical protein PHAVU_005G040200g [Phaseolus vulgaris]
MMNEVFKDRKLVITNICKCIYGNALPFNLVRSSLFVQMLKYVVEYGKGIKPPTYHEVRVSYLKKCTLMCDGWTDGKGMSLTNFLVNSPGGTVFLKFNDINFVVEEIAKDNVVQVVTDGASNFVAVGKMLGEKKTKLFWSPCAAHCLDLILEDIGKIPVFYNTIANAKKITSFIYRNTWVLNLYRKYSKEKELARPTFVTPLVKLLRHVDGDAKPVMPYIYEAMDRVKVQIASNFKNEDSRYKKVWEIIDTRWNLQLHKPLHATTYYRNLKFINVSFLFEIPVLWWESYGGEGKKLQNLVIRVLSLTCSATGLNVLVFVKYNLQLEMRQKVKEEKWILMILYIEYMIEDMVEDVEEEDENELQENVILKKENDLINFDLEDDE